jgi:hypothetical protein
MSVQSYPLAVASIRRRCDASERRIARDVLLHAKRFDARPLVHEHMIERTAALTSAAINAATTQNPVPLLFDMAVSRSLRFEAGRPGESFNDPGHEGGG